MRGMTIPRPHTLPIVDLSVTVAIGDTPAMDRVGELFTAFDQMTRFSVAVARSRLMSPGSRVFAEEVQVRSLRLASPLEIVLTSATTAASPVAYTLTGLYVLERLVNLIMRWQRHRIEIGQLQAQNLRVGRHSEME